MSQNTSDIIFIWKNYNTLENIVSKVRNFFFNFYDNIVTNIIYIKIKWVSNFIKQNKVFSFIIIKKYFNFIYL